jgi:hypothetical protein
VFARQCLCCIAHQQQASLGLVSWAEPCWLHCDHLQHRTPDSTPCQHSLPALPYLDAACQQRLAASPSMLAGTPSEGCSLKLPDAQAPLMGAAAAPGLLLTMVPACSSPGVSDGGINCMRAYACQRIALPLRCCCCCCCLVRLLCADWHLP